MVRGDGGIFKVEEVVSHSIKRGKCGYNHFSPFIVLAYLKEQKEISIIVSQSLETSLSILNEFAHFLFRYS